MAVNFGFWIVNVLAPSRDKRQGLLVLCGGSLPTLAVNLVSHTSVTANGVHIYAALY
ncbi:MAG: hypothetical protein ACFCVD_07940 [Nodosilinea sp.]